MISKLNNIRYNNICKNIIGILNKTKMTFEKEIKNNTKAFIYQSKITMENLLTYRFNYIEKGFTFSRIVGKINNDKLKNNNDNTFKCNAIATKDRQIPPHKMLY
jgi:hypothetical protein